MSVADEESNSWDFSTVDMREKANPGDGKEAVPFDRQPTLHIVQHLATSECCKTGLERDIRKRRAYADLHFRF